MPKAAIALGSNLGDREHHLRTAIERLRTLGQITAISSFLDTAPVGLIDQPRFLNAALVLQTEIPPLPLMQSLLDLERSLGRVRENVPAKGPRLIDLDLLLYDNQILETRGLTLPHPALHERAFVLEPLAEIAPDWIHPRRNRSIADLLQALRLELESA